MLKPQFSATTSAFDTWLHAAQQQAEAVLSTALPAANTAPTILHEAMRYAVLDGGKRIRPLLALAAGELCGAPPASALTVGCAVEFIHAYSLVHDDMPCMDNDILRRGKPTVHVAYGQACAMLVGDALQALAFELLAKPLAGVDAAVALRMVAVLAQGAGANGMVGGQQMDLLAENLNSSNNSNHSAPLDLPALQTLHRKKTGALLAASVTLGALAGYSYDYEAGVAEALNRYSAAIGLGFQIADDVLDATADTATLGKTSGKDAAQGKSTYVSLLGIAAAKQAAQQCLTDALAAIAPYGERAARLRELAHLIVARSF
jgi:farnesyl diphosphate synthase